MDIISFPTKIFVGKDALDRLTEIKGEKVFIVTDPYIESSGMIDQVTARLKSGDNKYQIFSDIVPDPPLETVVAGVKLVGEFSPEIFIAIGGGSAIDAAKAIKDFAEKVSHSNKNMNFIAIPTTSGTGSEVTAFSVITDQEKNIKYPLVSTSLIPDEAILETSLVMTVPPTITADTGIDVLTHALEAYVSTNANDFSDAFAEKAIQLIFNYLPRAYKDGRDLDAREKVHHASCLAGMAFNMVGLGINHSIAHACGAQFHIPHGRMNALLLTSIIEYNAGLQGYSNVKFSKAAHKYAYISKILGFSSTNVRAGVKSLIQHIKQLIKELNMPANLKSCGITHEQVFEKLEEISEAAVKDVCTNTNPRQPNKEDIQAIIKKLF